jgi:hypothetical protein
MTSKKLLLETTKAQEAVVEKLLEIMDRRNINYKKNDGFNYERAKLVGMMDMLDACKIDRKEFNWIFKL